MVFKYGINVQVHKIFKNNLDNHTDDFAAAYVEAGALSDVLDAKKHFYTLHKRIAVRYYWSVREHASPIYLTMRKPNCRTKTLNIIILTPHTLTSTTNRELINYRICATVRFITSMRSYVIAQLRW